MGEQESALDPDPQGFMSSFRLFYSTGQVSSPLRFSFESRCAKNNALCVDMLYGYVKIVPGPPAGTWPAMRAIIYDKKAPSAFQTTWMLMQGAGSHTGACPCMEQSGEKEEDCVCLRHSRRASWRTQSEFLLWTRSRHFTRATGRGQNSGCPTPRCGCSPCHGAPLRICHVLGSQ